MQTLITSALLACAAGQRFVLPRESILCRTGGLLIIVMFGLPASIKAMWWLSTPAMMCTSLQSSHGTEVGCFLDPLRHEAGALA